MTEFRKYVVDFSKEIVRCEQRSPPLKNGMCHLQYTDIDLGVVRRESRYQVLESVSFCQSAERGKRLTSTKVSQRTQKSESAITLIASPNCDWILEGTEIIKPISSFLIVTTSFSASL